MRFRLKTLFTFVTLVAILFCWLAFQFQRGRKQHLAAAAIAEAGGSIRYDFQMPHRRFPISGHGNDKATSGVPDVLRSLLGDDVFHSVVYVLLSGEHVTDDDLAHLANLPRLRKLYISGNAVTSDGLRHLRGLDDLEDLSLGIPMTDESLRHLSSLESLKFLFLMGDSRTYRRMQPKSKRLFDYEDYDSGVTREGVANLASKIPECRVTY